MARGVEGLLIAPICAANRRPSDSCHSKSTCKSSAFQASCISSCNTRYAIHGCQDLKKQPIEVDLEMPTVLLSGVLSRWKDFKMANAANEKHLHTCRSEAPSAGNTVCCRALIRHVLRGTTEAFFHRHCITGPCCVGNGFSVAAGLNSIWSQGLHLREAVRGLVQRAATTATSSEILARLGCRETPRH